MLSFKGLYMFRLLSVEAQSLDNSKLYTLIKLARYINKKSTVCSV